jgi:TetR/AcrR family transcriptional regulator, repressor of fatR-cypB operon
MNVHSEIIGAGMAGNFDKRKKIIKAALMLLTKHGFHAAPMSMIAEKAGVGTGTIYTYFKSKDILINAIYHEIENEILDHLSRNTPETRSIRERFIHLWTTLLKYLIANPINFRYIEQFHNSPFGVSLRRDRLTGNAGEPPVFMNILKDGILTKEIRNLPMLVLHAQAFGSLIVLARDHALGFIEMDAPLISRCAEACWDSICYDKGKLKK